MQANIIMGKKCIPIYDITGIQNFIFASNKAKENIGASAYMQLLFEKEIPQYMPEKTVTEWQGVKQLVIKNDDTISSEIIYIGGRNAMIAFASRELAVETTKKLSERILKDTQGTLGVIVTYSETDFENFIEDKEKLYNRLNANKASFIQSTPLRGISITEETGDGLPSSGERDQEKKNILISNSAALKQQYSGNELFKKLTSGEYTFPKDFDNLGRQEGESHIGVVHIEGNSLGSFIDSQLSNIQSYEEAVPIIRELSSNLDKLYKKVFGQLVKECAEAIKNKNVTKRLNLKSNYRPCSSINKLCPACLLFGTAGKNEALASRLSFSDAEVVDSLCGNLEELYEQPGILPELASPKPSATEFYLRKKDKKHHLWNYDYAGWWEWDKKDKIFIYDNIYTPEIQGRKFYWHHKINNPNYINVNNCTKRNVKIRPVKKGVKFKFRIYFNRIFDNELGKLLWTLTLGNSSEHAHKIGMGKPVGLGSVQIKVNKIKLRTMELNNNTIEYDIFDNKDNFFDYAFDDDISWLGSSKETIDALLKITNWKNAPSNIEYPNNADTPGKEHFKWFEANKTDHFSPKIIQYFEKLNTKDNHQLFKYRKK